MTLCPPLASEHVQMLLYYRKHQLGKSLTMGENHWQCQKVGRALDRFAESSPKNFTKW